MAAAGGITNKICVAPSLVLMAKHVICWNMHLGEFTHKVSPLCCTNLVHASTEQFTWKALGFFNGPLMLLASSDYIFNIRVMTVSIGS